jgi:hypothetical protein
MRNFFNSIGRFIDIVAKVTVLKKLAGDLRQNPSPAEVVIFLDKFEELTVDLEKLK